jgi:hypothetical protein
LITSRLYLTSLSASLAGGVIALAILGANQPAEFIATFTIIYLMVTYAVRPKRRDRPDIVALFLVASLALIIIDAALKAIR